MVTLTQLSSGPCTQVVVLLCDGDELALLLELPLPALDVVWLWPVLVDAAVVVVLVLVVVDALAVPPGVAEPLAPGVVEP